MNELKEALEEFMSSYYVDITHSQYELICNHINNLQSKIDKANEYIEKYTDKLKTTRIPKIDFNYNELLDILKEDK